MMVGLGMNFVGIDPIKALIYAALGNAFVAPVVLYFIVRISSNKQHMGHWVNRKLTTIVGWMVFGFMTVSAIAAVWAMLS
jgi:Mn2+/Fe2+ NRAMP family transporter